MSSQRRNSAARRIQRNFRGYVRRTNSREEAEKEIAARNDAKLNARKAKLEYKRARRRVDVNLSGPVLFTAPHGITLRRENHRNHGAERYTTEIAKELAKFFGGMSTITWNSSARPAEHCNLDPNYLRYSQFKLSPWHRNVKRWTKLFTNNPNNVEFKDKDEKKNTSSEVATDNNDDNKIDAAIAVTTTGPTPTTRITPATDDDGSIAPCPFHVDCHGKVDRKRQEFQNIDVGIMPMHALWIDKDFVNQLAEVVDAQLSEALEGTKFRVETNPRLHGYWGYERHTISEQSVRFGAPAMQLEMPSSFRKALHKSLHDDPDRTLFNRFAAGLKNTYQLCIRDYQIPDHPSIPYDMSEEC